MFKQSKCLKFPFNRIDGLLNAMANLAKESMSLDILMTQENGGYYLAENGMKYFCYSKSISNFF